MNLLRYVFLYIPAAVTTLIIIVEISLVTDFEEFQRDAFLSYCMRGKCVYERNSFQVGCREVVLPQVNAPVNLRP